MGTAGPGVAAVDAVQAAVRGKQRGQVWRGGGSSEKRAMDDKGQCEQKLKKTSAPRPEEAYELSTCCQRPNNESFF